MVELTALAGCTVQVRLTRVYVGTFCTSLDMAGFSLSLMATNPQLLARLDAPAQVGCQGWAARALKAFAASPDGSQLSALSIGPLQGLFRHENVQWTCHLVANKSSTQR